MCRQGLGEGAGGRYSRNENKLPVCVSGEWDMSSDSTKTAAAESMRPSADFGSNVRAALKELAKTKRIVSTFSNPKRESPWLMSAATWKMEK